MRFWSGWWRIDLWQSKALGENPWRRQTQRSRAARSNRQMCGRQNSVLLMQESLMNSKSAKETAPDSFAIWHGPGKPLCICAQPPSPCRSGTISSRSSALFQHIAAPLLYIRARYSRIFNLLLDPAQTWCQEALSGNSFEVWSAQSLGDIKLFLLFKPNSSSLILKFKTRQLHLPNRKVGKNSLRPPFLWESFNTCTDIFPSPSLLSNNFAAQF